MFKDHVMHTPLRLPCGIILGLAMLTACQPDSADATKNEPVTQQIATPADTSQTALDWPGSYQGVIPCADCPGIKVTLQLDANQQYQLSRYYQERADEPEQTSGQFRWSSDGRTIQLDDAANSQFLVGENRILQLNPQGERISGELAAQYWLDKQQTSEPTADALNIVGKWQLTELSQQAVDPDAKVFLQFDATGRVSCYTGCNNLSGGYQFQGPKLALTPLATTRKACFEETVEMQLLDVLSKADNVSIAGNELTLNRAKMAPLARFTRLEDTTEQ